MTKTQKIINSLFKDQTGKPFEATKGQAEIFKSIVSDDERRVAVKCITQYGKSRLTAMAVVFLCASSQEKILIIGPRKEQAQIIMDYVIEHVFDNEMFVKNVEIEGSLDRFKRQRSKDRIDWKTGAMVRVLTADTRTISKEAKGLMGFGASIIIVDESSLIPDDQYSKILRMAGGTDGKIVQLGNPFEKNHFWKALHSDRYKKIVVDYKQALKEGRITQEFLDEAKETMDPIDFGIFYECKFPDSASDALIPLSKLEHASQKTSRPNGDKFMGVDIARFGDDTNVVVVRQGPAVVAMEQWNGVDLVETRNRVQNLINQHNPVKVAIDEIGLGSGPVDEMDNGGYKKYGWNDSVGINVAKKPNLIESFANIRAEMYWNLRDRFIQDEISIPDDGELITQLSEIKYRHNSSGKKQMESKESMKKRGLKSPNKADALALAFYKPAQAHKATIDVY